MTDRQTRLNEEELKKLFRKPSPLATFWYDFTALVKYFFQFSLVFLSFFLVLNLPAFYTRIKFALAPSKPPELAPVSTPSNKQPSLVKIPEQLTPKIPPEVGENRIFIPAIKVDAPIIWNSPAETILQDLQNGVAHYKTTALPGEFGNVFLTGHSSNYWWDKGKFNQVFALLDKVKNGDNIYLKYKGKVYIYEVELMSVVKPSNIEVLNARDHSVVTLMTCTPVGTTINRLIVQARQIYPNPAKSGKRAIPLQAPDVLPVIR